MTESVKKVTERHTVKEMNTRDGETSIAVGLFIFALGVPVVIATVWALDNPRGAIVNAVCGVVLLLIGGGAILYGMSQHRMGRKP